MEIFRFIKWQWGRFHPDDKALFVIFFVLLCFVPTAFLYGMSLGYIVLWSFIISSGCLVLYVLYCKIIVQWGIYKCIKAAEEDEIVNKLKGRSY